MFTVGLTTPILSEVLYNEIKPQVEAAGLFFDELSDQILDESENLLFGFEMTKLGQFGSIYSNLKDEDALHKFLNDKGLSSLTEKIQGEVWTPGGNLDFVSDGPGEEAEAEELGASAAVAPAAVAPAAAPSLDAGSEPGSFVATLNLRRSFAGEGMGPGGL